MKIAIMGYGNLGKGIECAVRQNEDMELVAVFTRRNPQRICRSRQQSMQSILMSLTALTPMQRYPSILAMWTRQQKRAVRLQ